MSRAIVRCVVFTCGYLLTVIMLVSINAVSPHAEGTERILVIAACMIGGLALAYLVDPLLERRP